MKTDNEHKDYWTDEYVEGLHARIKNQDAELQQYREEVERLKLIISGKTFFNEKEVMENELQRLKEENERLKKFVPESYLLWVEFWAVVNKGEDPYKLFTIQRKNK